MTRVSLDTSRLPKDVLTYTDKQFYDFIKSFCGHDASDLISIQAIRSVDSFLSIQDIYSIFELDSDDLKDIQAKCGFKKRNGIYTVRPGIKSTLDHLSALLKEMQKKEGKMKKIQSASVQSTVSFSSSSFTDTPSNINTNINTNVTSSISKKDEVQHRAFIEKSIEEWCIKNEKIINIPNFNLISGVNYHLQFSSSLNNAEIKCSCDAKGSLPLCDSGNFKCKPDQFDLHLLYFVELFTKHNIMTEPLQEDYLELIDIKKKLTFNRPDGTCIIKLGAQHDIKKLFESLENRLINKEQLTTAEIVKEDLILSSDVIQKYPFLEHLVHFFINLSENVHPIDKPFLHYFLDNLLSNLSFTKNRYRYNEFIVDFALCLSIFAGRNGYEFIRLNIPGALPNLTTIQTKIAKEGFRALEGQFRYSDMKEYLTTVDSTFAYCAEDSTSAVRKIVYDVQSNAFVGFTLPLDEYGMPRVQHFQTNSFKELKSWFEEKDFSHLINLHMIQPICVRNEKMSPFALAAYGTNGKYTHLDVIRRWFKIFEESLHRGVRILGYSTDADPRYLLGMRLVSGFFSTLLNSPAIGHSSLFKIGIPVNWPWFYLPGEQLFLFMQDAHHICTKLRNRILSSSSYMLVGNNTINIDYLLELIESKSKFLHNLVKSDICPRDKQNYRSCEKLCDSLEYLKEIDGSHATVVYITIIHCIILAFINTSTKTPDRIYYAWLAVFICRLWRVWLHLVPKQELNDRVSEANNISEKIKNKFKKKKTKNMFFISSPTFLCIEINAHHLIYLTLLIADNQLPIEALKVFAFNSQTCENFFRLTRATSGTFSVSVNFSVQEYLHRQEKISVLNSIKTRTSSSFTNTKLKFPNHHKTQQNYEHSSTAPEKMTKQQIQGQVERAFQDAFGLLVPLGVEKILKKSKIINMKQVSEHIRKHFKKSSKKADFLISMTSDENYVQSKSKSNTDSETDTDSGTDTESETESETDTDSDRSIIEEDEQNKMDLYDYESEEEYDHDDGTNLLQHTTSSRLKNTKGLCDTINPNLKDSYFFINIDGKKKYLHKNTACWYLSNEKHKLSSDRLNRVMQK